MLLQTADKDWLERVEISQRGGYTCVGTERYVKANNKHLEDYADHLEATYGVYIDTNNLYGLAMCQYLPCSDIKINNAISYDDVVNTSDDAYIGYVVDVDISFLNKYMNY